MNAIFSKGRVGFAVAILAVLSSGAARADVLTFKEGKVMKGMIDEAGSNATFIRFTNSSGSIMIPRERIKKVDTEPKAQGFVNIGNEFKEQKKYQEAMSFYRQALKADANYKPARQMMGEVERALGSEKDSMRQGSLSEIDKLKQDIRKAISGGEFAKCEEMLKTSSNLVPSPEQKAELQGLVCDLYLAWARERMDKFDRPGAESKLNLSLAACPENDEVIELLLKLWEGQPDKQEQILQIYETVLKRRPDDQTLRRKLADLYYKGNRLEESAHHYLIIYKEGEKKYKGSPLEGLLIENLSRLHAQFANQKDYDRAIYFYKLLETIDPKSNPQVVTYYEYLKRAQTVGADDVAGRLALAAYCEQNGLDQEALDHYRLVREKDENNAEAKAAIDRFANSLIEQAQTAFNQQDFFLTKAIAEQVQKEFPESGEARTRAKELTASANNEITRTKREACDMALKYVERGDNYYNQAMVFYDRIFNQNYQNQNIRLSNPKSDAKRYFAYAVDAYQEALKTCPSLKSDPGSMIGPHLAEAQAYLKRMSGGAPPTRPYYGRVNDPDTPNPVNDPSGRRR